MIGRRVGAASISTGVGSGRCPARSSKPVARRSASRGGFDSHALPPARCEVDVMPDNGAPDGGKPPVPDIAAERQGGSDWAAYYRATTGREPRPLFLNGMAAVEASGSAPGQAA